MKAAQYGRVEVLELLIEYGADVNAVNSVRTVQNNTIQFHER